MKIQFTTVQPAPTNGFLAFARRFALSLLLAASLPSLPALASPAGELDPAFGEHGRILLREARFQEMHAVKAFSDPASGKLLAVASGWRDNALLRFNGDGSLDSGFGNQGVVTLDFGDNSLNIYDVERLADGKLLVAGAMNVYGDPDNVIHGSALLARLHADGTPDDAFGNHGLTMLQRGGIYESFSEILVQADGRIVVLGSTDRSGSTERILARYTKDGLVDSNFGDPATPGMSTIDLADDSENLVAIVQQNDGTLMACGNATSIDRSQAFKEILAVRIHANGMPDGTFGTNGRVLLGGQQTAREVLNCLALADGHLAIAGTRGSGEQQRAAVFRMTPGGRLDAGFGDNGMVVLPTARPSVAQAMLLMSDGSLAIAGMHLGPTQNSRYSWIDMLVARIDPTTGDIDQEFGNGGVTAVDFGTRDYASIAIPASLLQQPDGKLVAVGSQFDPGEWWDLPNIAITRLDPYGSGSNGWAGLNQTYASVSVGDGEVALHVRRTGGSSGPLSVDYRTVDDTATVGTAYVASSGTLSWPDGDMSDRTISITVEDTELAANYEYFSVELFDSSGGLAVDQATVAIRNSVPPPVTPPPGGGNNGGNGSAGGGGAIGIDLWLLLGLATLGLTRRSRRKAGDRA